MPSDGDDGQQIIYIDTNCFIHLRDLEDLPWNQLFPSALWVEIVVAPIVCEELDKFKMERDGRRRDRSRSALKRIEKASSDPCFRYELKAQPIRITLRLAAGEPFHWDSAPLLDPTRPDDQLVASVLQETESRNVTLVSFDTGPLIRGRLIGLRCTRAPEEWQLPEQPDQASQDIARLKRELVDARASKPNLLVRFTEATERPNLVRLSAPILPELSEQLQQILLAELQKKEPRASLRVNSVSPYSIFYPPDTLSTDQVDRYEQQYAAFVEKARLFFSNMHLTIRRAKRAVELEYSIDNTSSVTAHNLLVEFSSFPEAFLFGSVKDASKWTGGLDLPKPPDAPKSRFDNVNLMSSIHTFPELGSARSPTSFYWQERPSLKDKFASLICSEFRAKRSWKDSFWLCPQDRFPCSGSVDIEVSATNLPAPVRVSSEVQISEREATWTEESLFEALPDWISSIIRSFYKTEQR